MAHLPSRSSDCAAAQLGKGTSAPSRARTRGRSTGTVPPWNAILPLVRPQRCPIRAPERAWRGPHRHSASSFIMRQSVAIPADRQKRSKLAPTPCQASSINAVASGAGVVIVLFMALPFFQGVSTPSLQAQGGQRRLSYFNIERDIPGHGKVNHSIEEYVRGGFYHTNTVESYFSILKRGIIG